MNCRITCAALIAGASIFPIFGNIDANGGENLKELYSEAIGQIGIDQIFSNEFPINTRSIAALKNLLDFAKKTETDGERGADSLSRLSVFITSEYIFYSWSPSWFVYDPHQRDLGEFSGKVYQVVVRYRDGLVVWDGPLYR